MRLQRLFIYSGMLQETIVSRGGPRESVDLNSTLISTGLGEICAKSFLSFELAAAGVSAGKDMKATQ